MPFDLDYNVVLNTHVLAMIATLILVVISDVMALRWWYGWQETLSYQTMRNLHYAVASGLSISIVTGALMASSAFSYLLTQPAFVLKMVLVLLLAINALVIHGHLILATERSYSSLKPSERRKLLLSGGASTLGWMGVLIASQFFAL